MEGNNSNTNDLLKQLEKNLNLYVIYLKRKEIEKKAESERFIKDYLNQSYTPNHHMGGSVLTHIVVDIDFKERTFVDNILKTATELEKTPDGKKAKVSDLLEKMDNKNPELLKDLNEYLMYIRRIVETKDKIIHSQQDLIRNLSNIPSNTITDNSTNKGCNLEDYLSFHFKDGFDWDFIYDYLIEHRLIEANKDDFMFGMTGQGKKPSKYPYLKWTGSKSELSVFLRCVLGLNNIEDFKTVVYIFTSTRDYQGHGRFSCTIVSSVLSRKKINNGDMDRLESEANKLIKSTRLTSDNSSQTEASDNWSSSCKQNFSPFFESAIKILNH